MIIEIIYNLSVLVAISILAGFIKHDKNLTFRYALLQGFIFGTAAVMGMLHPFVFEPGLIFDGRSVMISLCGLFFGPIAAGLAAAMALVCRVWQGGIGAPMGVSVILSSALIGVGCYFFRLRHNIRITYLRLWLFGLMVHFVMLLSTVFLPSDIILDVLKRISLPVMCAYPLATIIIGKVLLDILDHRAAIDALRKSEEKFYKAFEISPVVMAISTAREGKLIDVNLAFTRLLGYSREEAVGKTTSELNIWLDAQERGRVYRAVMEKPFNEGVEFSIRGKEGRIFTGVFSAEHIHVNDEPCYLTAFYDMTERKRIEQELRESEQRFRSYFDLPLVGIAITSFDKRWVQVNDQLCVVLGYSVDELRLLTWEEMTHPDDLAADVAQFNRLLSREIDRYKMEKRFFRKDGRVIWVDLAVGCVCDAQGRVEYVVAVINDITERKQAQEYALEMAATRAAAETARKKAAEIAEAYQQLEKIQGLLIQAEKLAAVGTLSAGLAHELNNPLTGILGIARYYVAHKDPSDKEHADHKEIVQAGERMARIIRELLDFARPSQGEIELLDGNELVEDVLRFGRKAILGDDVMVQKDFARELPMIRVDKDQFQQIILNIIGNAVDAMQNKGVLKIATRTVTGNHRQFVEFEFADNGCGIKEQDLGRIFDPFFTTKRPGKGTGLGLPVARSIVERHGGTISVESPPAGQGAGAAFKIRVPVAAG